MQWAERFSTSSRVSSRQSSESSVRSRCVRRESAQDRRKNELSAKRGDETFAGNVRTASSRFESPVRSGELQLSSVLFDLPFASDGANVRPFRSFRVLRSNSRLYSPRGAVCENSRGFSCSRTESDFSSRSSLSKRRPYVATRSPRCIGEPGGFRAIVRQGGRKR